MDAARKRKWLEIADRYPKMGKDEQERIQRRMSNWAAMAPDERKQVREKYKQVKQASPEEREALKKKWERYEALPDEEKQRLKASAATKAAEKKSAVADTSRDAGQPVRAKPSLIPPLGQPSSSAAKPSPPIAR